MVRFSVGDRRCRRLVTINARAFGTRIDRGICPRGDRPLSARERIFTVFEVQAGWTRQHRYRGCAFTRAVAEPLDGEQVPQAVEAYRHFILTLLTGLVEKLPATEPTQLGL